MAPPHRSSLDRRTFLGAAGALGAAALTPTALSQFNGAPKSTGKARNVILAVSDGLSPGVLSILDLARRHTDGGASRWLQWMNEPGVSTTLVETTPAIGVRTDSAAAASAWSIGQRVVRGAISYTTDGSTPTPLFVRAKETGRRVGLVTTAKLTDATPAAMMCNAKSRAEHDNLAQQYINNGLDFGIGGGAKHFNLREVRRRGIVLAERRIDLRRAVRINKDRAVLGLLDESILPHALDREYGDLVQREAAELALAHLSESPKGFCLLFENENTDNASHANDAASLVRDLHDFEQALDVLIEFTRSRDDTLLIATTDHGCANPGFASADEPGVEQLQRMMEARRSFAWINRQFRNLPQQDQTAEVFTEIVRGALGISITDDETPYLESIIDGSPLDAYEGARNRRSVLGSIVANHFGVAFNTRHHTTDLVIATAMGPGSESLPPLCHHTDLHRVMVDALGLV